VETESLEAIRTLGSIIGPLIGLLVAVYGYLIHRFFSVKDSTRRVLREYRLVQGELKSMIAEALTRASSSDEVVAILDTCVHRKQVLDQAYSELDDFLRSNRLLRGLLLSLASGVLFVLVAAPVVADLLVTTGAISLWDVAKLAPTFFIFAYLTWKLFELVEALRDAADDLEISAKELLDMIKRGRCPPRT